MEGGGGATIHHRGRRFKRTSSGKQEGISSLQSRSGKGGRTAAVPSLGLSPHFTSSDTIVLSPPTPPQLTTRGRPLSAKGRPRPQSVITSNTKIQQFQHQRFKPLPSIGAPAPSLHTRTSCRVATGHVTETDSAVDLDYASSSSPSPISHPPTPSLRPTIIPHHPPHSTLKVIGRHSGLSVLPHRTVLKVPARSQSPRETCVRSLAPRDSCSSKSLNFNANNNDCASTIVASKPTPATHLKSSQADSRIPEEPLASEPHTVLLCIKLPSGCRVKRRFRLSDLLCHVMTFAIQHCAEEEEEEGWELSTSDVPRRVFEDLSLSLKEAGLAVRTLLHLTLL